MSTSSPAPRRTTSASRRSGRRARRAVAVGTLLGAGALFLAPAAAFADSYNNVSVAPNTEVLGVKYSSDSGSGSAAGTSAGGSSVEPAKASSPGTSSSLAFTGFEAGAAGLVGVAMVTGGTVMIVSGRRRTARH